MFLGGLRRDIPRAGCIGRGDSQGQVKLAGQTGSWNRSLLARAGNTRIGARAFPTLEGLCGPERAIRSWLRVKIERTTDHRRGSRLRSEEDRREAATMGLLCALERLKNAVQDQNGPKGLCAAEEREVTGF